VEVVQMIQISILLMGNMSVYHSKDRRRALLQHLNPQLKQLVEESDFKDATPMLFGENFRAVAKTRLDAALTLKKTLVPNKWKRGFQQSHPQKGWVAILRPVAREEDGSSTATKFQRGPLSPGDD